MGNQQATGNLELAWLGGLMDGEGCFSLTKRMRGDLTNYNVNVIVSNADARIIERTHEILSANGVGHYVNWKSPGDNDEINLNGRHGKRRYLMGEVRIMGLMRCKKVCELMVPYLYMKQPQATTMLSYINLRLEKTIRFRSVAKGGKTSYGPEEEAMYMSMKEMKIPAAPETIRRTHRHGDKTDGYLPWQDAERSKIESELTAKA